MKNFSIWALVKARWGWRDVRHFFLWSTLSALLKWFSGTVSLTYTAGTVITSAPTWAAFLALFGACLLFYVFLYLLYFLGSILVYSIIVYGAKQDHGEYRELYEEYLAGEGL